MSGSEALRGDRQPPMYENPSQLSGNLTNSSLVAQYAGILAPSNAVSSGLGQGGLWTSPLTHVGNHPDNTEEPPPYSISPPDPLTADVPSGLRSIGPGAAAPTTSISLRNTVPQPDIEDEMTFSLLNFIMFPPLGIIPLFFSIKVKLANHKQDWGSAKKYHSAMIIANGIILFTTGCIYLSVFTYLIFSFAPHKNVTSSTSSNTYYIDVGI